MTYAALDGVSSGGLRLLISSKLSKLVWNYCHFGPKNEVFGLLLVEIWRYGKWDMAKRCTMWSCILYVSNAWLWSVFGAMMWWFEWKIFDFSLGMAIAMQTYITGSVQYWNCCYHYSLSAANLLPSGRMNYYSLMLQWIIPCEMRCCRH